MVWDGRSGWDPLKSVSSSLPDAARALQTVRQVQPPRVALRRHVVAQLPRILQHHVPTVVHVPRVGAGIPLARAHIIDFRQSAHAPSVSNGSTTGKTAPAPSSSFSTNYRCCCGVCSVARQRRSIPINCCCSRRCSANWRRRPTRRHHRRRRNQNRTSRHQPAQRPTVTVAGVW